MAALAIEAVRPATRRPRHLRVLPHPARTFAPSSLASRTPNGRETVTVSPAAVCDRYCWLTVASTHGDRAATAEALLDGRQVRALIRTLSRASRSLDHNPRPRRIGRRAVRNGERAFRVTEKEWQDRANGLELPEDF